MAFNRLSLASPPELLLSLGVLFFRLVPSLMDSNRAPLPAPPPIGGGGGAPGAGGGGGVLGPGVEVVH